MFDLDKHSNVQDRKMHGDNTWEEKNMIYQNTRKEPNQDRLMTFDITIDPYEYSFLYKYHHHNEQTHCNDKGIVLNNRLYPKHTVR